MVAIALTEYLREQIPNYFDNNLENQVTLMQSRLRVWPSPLALAKPGDPLYDKELAKDRERIGSNKVLLIIQQNSNTSLDPITAFLDKPSLIYKLSRCKDEDKEKKVADFFLNFWHGCLDGNTLKGLNGKDKVRSKSVRRQIALIMAIYSSFMTEHMSFGNYLQRAAYAAFELHKILGGNMRIGLVNARQHDKRDHFVVLIGPKSATKKSNTWMVFDPLNNPYKLMPRKEYRDAVLPSAPSSPSDKARFKLALRPEDLAKQREMIPKITELFNVRSPKVYATNPIPPGVHQCGDAQVIISSQ